MIYENKQIHYSHEQIKNKYIQPCIYILYHGAWEITIVPFDVPCAHNLLADSVKFHSLHNEILNDKL